MKKVKYYKTEYIDSNTAHLVKDGIKATEAEGEEFKLSDKNNHPFTFYIEKVANAFEKPWRVTEKTTGALVCSAKKKDEVLEELNKRLNLIYNIVENQTSLEDCKSVISEAYESQGGFKRNSLLDF